MVMEKEEKNMKRECYSLFSIRGMKDRKCMKENAELIRDYG